jgi:hypothetical protein
MPQIFLANNKPNHNKKAIHWQPFDDCEPLCKLRQPNLYSNRSSYLELTRNLKDVTCKRCNKALIFLGIKHD